MDLYVKKIVSKISNVDIFAFFSTLIFGILGHGYIMFNPIFNWDSIKIRNEGMLVGFQLGRFTSYFYDLLFKTLGYIKTVPFMSYFFCILMISCSSVLFCRIFEIKNKVNAILISGILILNTALVQIFSFDFTANAMTASIFMSFVSSYFVIKNINKVSFSVKGFLLLFIMIFLTAISIGIYQGGLPTFITILVFHILYVKNKNNNSMKEVIILSVKFIFIIVFSLILYLVMNNCFRAINNIDGSSITYAGMNRIGVPSYNVSLLVKNIIKAFCTPFAILLFDYGGFNFTLLSKLIILFIYIFLLLYLVVILFNSNSPIFDILIIICIPFAVCFQRIMMLETIGERQIYSIFLLFTLPLILNDSISFCKNKIFNKYFINNNIKNLLITCIYILFILHMLFITNGNYHVAHMNNEYTKNITNQIVSDIHNVDGYNDKYKVAFIGDKINSDSIINRENDNKFHSYLYVVDIIFCVETRKSIFNGFANYNYEEPTTKIVNNIDELNYVSNIFYKIGGYNSPTYSTDIRIKEMPIYPNDGSIKIIDDVIVVKLDNNY